MFPFANVPIDPVEENLQCKPTALFSSFEQQIIHTVHYTLANDKYL